MRKYLLRVLTAGTIVSGLGSSMAIAQSAIDNGVPAVPTNIEVPLGYDVFLKGHALGTQNYVCLPATPGVSWKFIGPQATLFLTFNGEISQQLTTHFLSANPSENDLPRPTWQHSLDSSRVWGRVLQSSSDSNFVEAGAIPWLLLEAVGAQLGPTGGPSLTQTAFIQRLNTSGGIAPSTGCSRQSDIGRVALVPYAADYFFYREK